MKKILVICMICVFLLCGCTPIQVEKTTTKKEETSMFIIIEEALTWRVVYHKDTKVMYAVSFGTYNNGTFTLLVNADGTPMLYEGGAE